MSANVDVTKVRWEYHPEKGESYKHAFYIPGLGYYGGLRPDIARYIVDCVNGKFEASHLVIDNDATSVVRSGDNDVSMMGGKTRA